MLLDLHMHSHHSKCAQPNNTIQTMSKAAIAAGVDAIGITDHLHPHTSPDIYSDNRQQVGKWGDEKKDEANLTIWVGAEVDVLTFTGDITGSPEIYDQLDYVLAGVHHYHLDWVEGPEVSNASTEEILLFSQQNLINTIRNPWVHAIAHPWVGIFKVFKYDYEHLRREWIQQAGEEARKHRTALEIPVWAAFKDGEPDGAYWECVVRPLIETGCMISTGTDSHHLENIGGGIEALTQRLLEMGAAKEQLWSPLRIEH